MEPITLQINLSAGDVAYARQTVPPLVAAHRASAAERLAVVDCCRPQRTRHVDPDARFPEPGFSNRVAEICAIAEELRAQGHFDRVVYLRPGDPLLRRLARRYLRGLVRGTHDAGGAGLLAYFAGLELPAHRYVVHYDADMLLHQAPGYDWALAGRELLARNPGALATTPRYSPPFSGALGLPDAPSLREGLPFTAVEGGWRNTWFSTRCWLMDRARLGRYLPLVSGRLGLEHLGRMLLRRSFPMSPEVMLHRRVRDAGGWMLHMSAEEAWLLHPATKTPRYVELLGQIQRAVQEGSVPEGQRGYCDLDLPLWERWLAGAAVPAHGGAR